MIEQFFEKNLIYRINEVSRLRQQKVYIVGGTVRDWLMKSTPFDLDLVIDGSPMEFANEIIKILGRGKAIVLGKGKNSSIKMFYKAWQIDIAGLAENTTTILEDLCLRDFTINAIAIPIESTLLNADHINIFDPLQGRVDLQNKLLRATKGAFERDPLRMLRAFRFVATKSFKLTEETLEQLKIHSEKIVQSAPERIKHELDKIIATPFSGTIFQQMSFVGLLQKIIPEIFNGDDSKDQTTQFTETIAHGLHCLRNIENIFENHQSEMVEENLVTQIKENATRARVLKTAALLMSIPEMKIEMSCVNKLQSQTDSPLSNSTDLKVEQIAQRLKWSKNEFAQVACLMRLHVLLFKKYINDECNRVSPRFVLRYFRRIQPSLLDDLYLLALSYLMAEGRAQCMKKCAAKLKRFYENIRSILENQVLPVLQNPPLLSGTDLQRICGLTPGKDFKKILGEIEELHVEGLLTSKEDAVLWVQTTYSGCNSRTSS